ncbi:MucR family transcriptional regulator [Streptomyces sp. NPDC092296]|uniref:MucR family transcriptional regulator n=1 Tax=Streptomyces sp. NPDC092296 TaxID=3366012 RepID=UPI00382F71E3
MPQTPAPGVQPEEDGRLQCLECDGDGWYKLLAPHLARVHGMTSDQYRQKHRLPRRLSLRAAHLNDRARAQGVARYASRPDIRSHMAAGRQAIDPARSVEGTRETAEYAMVRETHRRGGQGRRDAARRRADQHAQAAGFPAIEDYLRARSGTPLARMARELDLPRSTVNTWITRMEEADFLARVVGHLCALADGGEGSAEAAAWRAQVPKLARLEERLRAPFGAADAVLDQVLPSRSARQGAYLAALMTHGGDPEEALLAADLTARAVSEWRYVAEGWRAIEDAVRDYARRTPAVPHEVPGVPLTDEERSAFLDALRRGVPTRKAARQAGRAHFAFLSLRQSDPEFREEWDQARVLRGRPRTVPLDEGRLAELIREGWPFTEIDRRLGVCTGASYRRAVALGLHEPTPRPRKGDRQPDSE